MYWNYPSDPCPIIIMGRFEKGIPVREVLIKHLKPIQARVDIVNRMNEDMEPDDLYQMLVSYF